MEAHHYTVELEWAADRIGILSSPQLRNQIEVATPPQFPKGVEGIWSPEHLFTSAVSSCFMTTFLSIAEKSKLEFSKFSCTAKGTLDQIDGAFAMTEITLEPVLTILAESDRDKALKLLEKSETYCLISNSIRSKVILNPTIKI
ncbi:MAG: OsmC family protein [Chitinophagales bacterium]|nr:OsmC family protein [Chitinophagales bacterium]